MSDFLIVAERKRKNIKDHSSHCAAMINEYWRKRGYNAEAVCKEIRIAEKGGRSSIFIIQSNMVDGIPTKRLTGVLK